jgi:hypothetical protein
MDVDEPARPLSRAEGDRAAERYRLQGAVVAWTVPLLTGAAALAATTLGAVDLALVTVVLGWGWYALCRSTLLELSATALTRGIVLGGTFLPGATVIALDAIVAVHTDWRRPGDHSALETVVRDREGRAIRFSTAMGLDRYWACLATVVRAAPRAARSGVTEAVLADGPPARRHAVSAALTAGALALVLAAMVAVHYLWAQGRSSHARQLEAVPGVSASPGAADR